MPNHPYHANRILFEICQQYDNYDNKESNDSSNDSDSDSSSKDAAEGHIVDQLHEFGIDDNDISTFQRIFRGG